MMNRFIRLFTVFMLLSTAAFSQAGSGEIFGRVTDDKNQPLDFASVQALEGGIVKGGGKTDINGYYKIKPIAAGTYTVKVTYAGFNEMIVKEVLVYTDARKEVNIKMEPKTVTGTTVTVIGKKLIDNQTVTRKIGKEELAHMPTINTGDMLSTMTSVYQRRQGDNSINIGGDRSGGTMYMIDGMMIRGSRNVNLPPSTIQSMEMLTNGLSAKFGNATGGFPVIQTRGISPELGGSIMLQHSVDGYNTNLLSVDLSGPLLKVKRPGVAQKVPVIGFSINASFNYNKDDNPNYLYYKLNADTLKKIQDYPLVQNPNGNGAFVRASEMVTDASFIKTKARQYGENYNGTFLGKLDFQPTSQISVRLGTLSTVNSGRSYSRANSLFAPNANPYVLDYSLRGYVLLTHRLGKAYDKEKKEEKKSSISNAFYTIQFTYQKDKVVTKNPVHKDNLFDYGYIGKFTTNRREIYGLGIDTASKLQGQVLYGEGFTGMTFEPGGMNPLLENYTNAVYNYYESKQNTIFNMTQLQGLGGLRNGDGPPSTYSLFTSSGAQMTSRGLSESDRATLNIDASLDIEQGKKDKLGKSPITHNVQFGLGYDQSNGRYWNVGASGLWYLMRLITNRHIQDYDLQNPIFVVGGQNYTYDQLVSNNINFSFFDTIRYDRKYVGEKQARFDKELRKQLFGSETYNKLIDIDRYAPSTFSLNMFSADDLFNQGEDFASWGGYDYLGNRMKKQPSFGDFWTKKDSRGDYARPIGSFRPIYMFGYILDRFSYKNLSFNIGLRVDRYDANQKVLKDPYSLYGVQTASDIKAGTYKTATDKSSNTKAPEVSSFSGDYVVYVDNNQSSYPTVVGYRKNDTWYDPFGKVVSDPTILSGLYAGGLPIQPWLLNKSDSIKSENFNVDNSFKDYKPQVALSPRVQFIFPISDHSQLYGNYDVVTQQPASGNSWVTPDDYYFLRERQSAINNANLRMEKGINYSLGFQQTLSKTAVMTVEAYYRERRNQIQAQRYNLAYPISYETFGNRDFSSTTGTSVKLEFTRPKKKPIRLDVNYTLQFAEGTGSSTVSQRSLLASGQPNLRTLFPLSFDSRHMINVSIDYRYKGGNKGPKIGKSYPFENAGVNLLFTTRSGEPYTRLFQAVPLTGGDFISQQIVGTINGSRLPWNYLFNIRLDKDFTLNPKGKIRRFINVYTYVNNLLNTRNTVGVYAFSGLPTDDAYLPSSQGQQNLQNNYQFQQSFVSMYNYAMFNSGNLSVPRRMYVGCTFDF